MKILDVKQGTTEWMDARLGMPTASQYDRLLTPKTRKPSSARDKYRAELVAEWLLGQPLDWGSTDWMERGMEMEDEARRWYAFERDVDVVKVGVVTRDDGKTGGSPDGLVTDDGGLEIKCPNAAQHVRYMLGIDELSHTGQVQGYMYLTDRKWWDVVSYHPELPPVVLRVERDEEYIAALLAVLDPFIEQVEADKARFKDHRVIRPWHPEMQSQLIAQEAA